MSGDLGECCDIWWYVIYNKSNLYVLITTIQNLFRKVSAKPKSWGQKSFQRLEWIQAQIWRSYFLLLWNFPRSAWSPLFWNGGRLVQTGLFSATCLAKLNHLGLSERRDHGPSGHSGWAAEILCADGRIFTLERSDRRLSSATDSRKPTWSFSKCTYGLGKPRFLVWWKYDWTLSP